MASISIRNDPVLSKEPWVNWAIILEPSWQYDKGSTNCECLSDETPVCVSWWHCDPAV